MTDRYRRPDGRPKNTGRELFESVATVRIDETQASDDRVAIHVEHPAQDRGVACFFGSPASSAVAAVVRSHLGTEIELELSRVEIIDTIGIGIAEQDVLPRTMAGVQSPEVEYVR